MSRHHCDQERRVWEAAHSGPLNSSLQEHVNGCAICADVVTVVHFFAKQPTPLEEEMTLPDAGLLWWKAQLRSREAAVARAARPIDLVTMAGSAAAGFAAVWFVSTSSLAREWIGNFVHPQILQHAGGAFWGELALLGGLGTIICILIGSVFTLRA